MPLVSYAEIQEAFLLGVRGMPLECGWQVFDQAVVTTDEQQGAIEIAFQNVEFVPSFANATSAYEAGRCLRMIGYLLDRSGIRLQDARKWVTRLKDKPSTPGPDNVVSYWDKKSICSLLGEIAAFRDEQIQAIRTSAISYADDRPVHQVLTVQGLTGPPP